MADTKLPHEDAATARRRKLRRHGLQVNEEDDTKVTITMDIPNDRADHPSSILDFAHDIVTRRIITQEFANPTGPPPDKHRRLAFTVNTIQPTPHTVYVEIEEVLGKVRSGNWREAVMPPLNSPVVKERMCMYWTTTDSKRLYIVDTEDWVPPPVTVEKYDPMDTAED